MPDNRIDHSFEIELSQAQYPDLADKVIVISGGASGIGASLVAHFAKQNAQVVFCDIAEQAMNEVVRFSENLGKHSPKGSLLNLRNTHAVKEWIAEIMAEFGKIDCLINNAGNDAALKIADLNEQNIIDTFELNFKHQIVLSAECSKYMPPLSSIINMGSISWMLGVPGVSAYTSMKAAIEGLTRSFSRELGEKQIRVNSIAPGWILTQKQLEKGRSNPKKFNDYLSKQALKEFLSPADISRFALWLASAESRRVTGQTFIIDAGTV
jgi:NAD(P)-dependent dehydrogenase (short-subunit alcohol dehydrogenase family)